MSRRSFLALGVGAAAAGCVGVRTESPAPLEYRAPGTWVTLAPMPTARQEVAAAAVHGQVYVIGGFGPGALPTTTVEMYDPPGNLWEARQPLPEATHHPAAAAVGDRLFAIGGYTGGRVRWEPTAAVYEYDPRRNIWSPRAPLPTPRGALAAAVVGGRIHAVGGTGPDGVTGAHEVYDPAADRWTRANAMPTPRDHLAAAGFQDRLWAIGGRTSFMGTQYDSVEVYDPGTDSWRTAPRLPQARGGLAAAALADRVLVFGGESPFRIFESTEMYEPAGNRWISLAPMPTPRHGVAAVVVGDRVYLAGGGSRPGYAAVGTLEAFQP